MISVIIPVYNQADKITKTLDSLIRQTYSDIEIILVNDGSTDDLDGVLENYFRNLNSQTTFWIIHQINKGAPAARNAGFHKSIGQYVFFCDADAILAHHALEIMLQELEAQPEAAYVFSAFYWGSKMFKVGPFDEARLRREPFIHTMSLIRRSAFPATGWDESVKKLQDWDLWLTMLENGQRGYFIDKVLFKVLPGGHISTWLPAAVYSLMPFLPTVRKYKEAVAIIKKKHNLV
jgi:glycosyltransferase involved in cell wall biosynthesis